MNQKQRKKAKSLLKMSKCRYCRSTENLTIDHKIPKVQGGTDKQNNLQCLCKRCNGIKSGLPHKQVMLLFQWFLSTEESRTLHRYKTYAQKRKRTMEKKYGIVGVRPSEGRYV